MGGLRQPCGLWVQVGRVKHNCALCGQPLPAAAAAWLSAGRRPQSRRTNPGKERERSGTERHPVSTASVNLAGKINLATETAIDGTHLSVAKMGVERTGC